MTLGSSSSVDLLILRGLRCWRASWMARGASASYLRRPGCHSPISPCTWPACVTAGSSVRAATGALFTTSWLTPAWLSCSRQLSGCWRAFPNASRPALVTRVKGTPMSSERKRNANWGCQVSEASGRRETLRKFQFGAFGLEFVSVAALLLLVSIVGERMGLLGRAFIQLPGWVAFLLVAVGGYPIFRGLVRDLSRRRVTAHAVMVLGLGAALAVGEYSTAVVIVFFMRAGEYIENFTMSRSRAAIRALTEAAPETATVCRGGQEQVIRATDVLQGDLAIVRPGQRIPVDGVVVEGRAEVNQAPITGESNPATKQVGDKVFAASVNQLGYLEIRAEQVGSDATKGRILRLVEEAQASKAPVQRLADKFSAYFIPVVLLAAGLAWLTTGKVMNAVAVFFVACGSAFAIA